MLKDNPELYQLYKDLVVSGVITAEEFWANRAKVNVVTYIIIHSGQMQRACTIWTDLMTANYWEIQNTFSKRQKITQFLEREALNVEYL